MPGTRPRAARKPLQLRLYIAGNAPNSTTAMANIQMICDQHFATQYELEIVDMLWHPQRALDDEVLVTPTLLKLKPLPAHRVIGDLSDTAKVLMMLRRE